MSDLRELYQGLIIDHGKRPRHFGALDCANRKAKGLNPLCGDQLTLYLNVEENRIKEVKFQGSGCAISVASASLMAERLTGKTESEAIALFRQFHQWITTESSNEEIEEALQKLIVFTGVRAFPTRIKCATLAWHTLQSALAHILLSDAPTVVSTEDKN